MSQILLIVVHMYVTSSKAYRISYLFDVGVSSQRSYVEMKKVYFLTCLGTVSADRVKFMNH